MREIENICNMPCNYKMSLHRSKETGRYYFWIFDDGAWKNSRALKDDELALFISLIEKTTENTIKIKNRDADSIFAYLEKQMELFNQNKK